MSSINTVYVVGSSNTDMVIQTPRIPHPGETILGGRFFMNAGGKGANQAVSAARLGGKVVFIGKVGNDPFGKQTLMDLEKEQIHTQYVEVDPELPSGIALINVDGDGENAITVAAGANANLTITDVTKGLTSLTTDDVVLLQLEIPLTTVFHTLECASSICKRIILNPAPFTHLPDYLYEKMYVITPNETEASLLTGITVEDLSTAHAASEHLFQKGCPHVVITMGSAGAYVYSPDFQGLVPTEKVTAVDTTAAGDCFNGALAVSLAEGQSLVEAVQFANRAAAISVTRLGAQQSMPFRSEI